ncbi:Pyruvate kinase [Dictyocoela roeselum]|nr:Pyruvate kinase [Dictyocoela roeselum]
MIQLFNILINVNIVLNSEPRRNYTHSQDEGMVVEKNILRNLDATKIIASIGPSSADPKILRQMVNKGMSVARLNLSHISDSIKIREHIKAINEIRGDGVPGIAIDTRGPEVRIQNLKSAVSIRKGDYVVFQSDSFENNNDQMIGEDTENPKNYELKEKEPNDNIFIVNQTFDGAKIGSIVKIDDAQLCLQITEVSDFFLKTIAMNDHQVSPNKKVMVPCTIPKNSQLDDDKKILRDVEDIIDYVFISFVNCAKDVLDIKNIFKNKVPLLYAKIESEEALNKLDEIIDVSDGIMIARGDLSIAVGFERLFKAQNIIMNACKAKGKPVIMATQMLDSMKHNRYPTNAEVSDVGYAVLNGCDCVMLSAESSVGMYPVECVEMMSAICRNAESLIPISRYGLAIDLSIIVTDKWECLMEFKDSGKVVILCSKNEDLLGKASILKNVNPLYVEESIFRNINAICQKVKQNFAFENMYAWVYHEERLNCPAIFSF